MTDFSVAPHRRDDRFERELTGGAVILRCVLFPPGPHPIDLQGEN